MSQGHRVKRGVWHQVVLWTLGLRTVQNGSERFRTVQNGSRCDVYRGQSHVKKFSNIALSSEKITPGTVLNSSEPQKSHREPFWAPISTGQLDVKLHVWKLVQVQLWIFLLQSSWCWRYARCKENKSTVGNIISGTAGGRKFQKKKYRAYRNEALVVWCDAFLWRIPQCFWLIA